MSDIVRAPGTIKQTGICMPQMSTGMCRKRPWQEAGLVRSSRRCIPFREVRYSDQLIHDRHVYTTATEDPGPQPKSTSLHYETIWDGTERTHAWKSSLRQYPKDGQNSKSETRKYNTDLKPNFVLM